MALIILHLYLGILYNDIVRDYKSIFRRSEGTIRQCGAVAIAGLVGHRGTFPISMRLRRLGAHILTENPSALTTTGIYSGRFETRASIEQSMANPAL
jgi:hypothetical protein